MPRTHRWSWMIGLLLVALSVTGGPQSAQAQENLLTDPGFESEAVWKNVITAEDNSASFNVAPAWNGWLTQTPRNESWQNVIPNGYPHNKSYEGEPFVRSGNRSQNIGRGGGTFTAAVYQTVAVEEGTNLIGSAWVTMDIPQEGQSQARVGIDPNGGNSPFDSDVVWSAWAVNHIGQMRQLTVQATATGSAVTLWLYATQTFPSNPNGVFWDDASLIVGGSGGGVEGEEGDDAGEGGDGEAPQESAPPAVAPFVQAQGAQDDGSIIHTVQAGDTLDAIAVAYGVPTTEIIELNDLANPRFLQIGQQLIIAESGATSGDDADDTAVDDEETADEDDATEEPADDEETADEDDATEEPADDEETVDEDDATEEPADDEETADEDDTEPTARPSTPTPAPTAPVAVADATDDDEDITSTTGSVCVLMFEDANMNRLQDQDEVALAGGTITLARDAEEVGSFVSDDTGDPFCFDDLEPGEYTASALPPPNYGLTTPTQLVVRVRSGSDLTVQFGAATGVEVAQAPPPDSGGLEEEEATEPEPEAEDENPLVQNLGLILFGLAGATLVGGTALAFLLRRR